MRIIDQLTVLQTIRDGKAIGDVKFRAHDAGICDFDGHITPDGERRAAIRGFDRNGGASPVFQDWGKPPFFD